MITFIKLLVTTSDSRPVIVQVPLRRPKGRASNRLRFGKKDGLKLVVILRDGSKSMEDRRHHIALKRLLPLCGLAL